MPTCSYCQKEVNAIVGLFSFNKKTGRCKKCESEIGKKLSNFRQKFLEVSRSGIINQFNLNLLYQSAQQNDLIWSDALEFVRGDALHLMERALTMAAADGVITDEEINYIEYLRKSFHLPPDLARPINDRLQYLKHVSDVRQGRLPTIRPNVHLETDEICHLETEAAYQKVNTRSINYIYGRLLATNKKLHFLSPNGGWEINWNKVIRVERDSRSVYLELSVKKGNGSYLVSDPLLTEATIDAITRISKRHLVNNSDGVSRHIPQDIKTAVWQRDQGKCVQCKDASYLEFDHIIPFSKGGANTVNNVQLLCRRCNLNKRDRI
jgi:5-methylcytosine-specific restriction endonuclease McrA